MAERPDRLQIYIGKGSPMVQSIQQVDTQVCMELQIFFLFEGGNTYPGKISFLTLHILSSISKHKHCAQNERFITIAAYSGLLL